MRPSFIGLFATGILNLASVILFLFNYKKFTSIQLLGVILLFSISIGIHSLLHGHQEVYYGFNPLEGKLAFNGKQADCPCKGKCMMQGNCPYRRNM